MKSHIIVKARQEANYVARLGVAREWIQALALQAVFPVCARNS